ncbi:uncharacterized protein LOC109820256 isoform X3 [Asparagus officinalis]|nr:uncharacterized protein LOC109820256 isoform X3 [Asparagus officinalis]
MSSSSSSNDSSSSESRKSSVQRRIETPSTPGRPIFNFSIRSHSKKSIPSKWENAEKWLMSSSCHESPAHVKKSSDTSKFSRQNSGFHQKDENFEEKMRVNVMSQKTSALCGDPSEVFLKDKFTDNLEPTKEGFLFSNSMCEPVKNADTGGATEVHHRDIGTEMTPLNSSTTTRFNTPIKSLSPARHNTPANRSGPLMASGNCIDISELKDCHFAKLDLGAQFDSVPSKWSSREEEEEEISKSLRHFEMDGGRKSIEEARDFVWEDEERTKSCIRYQREEARIQAWMKLQKAKAEAQSRKLEVKIQKMRSDLEEKLMKRMAVVNRRAEEWRASAQLQHSQQIIKACEQAQKMRSQRKSHFNNSRSCGCFPCNSQL